MRSGGRRIIAIASGKGGTGKTTIAAHLAIMAANATIHVRRLRWVHVPA